MCENVKTIYDKIWREYVLSMSVNFVQGSDHSIWYDNKMKRFLLHCELLFWGMKFSELWKQEAEGLQQLVGER